MSVPSGYPSKACLIHSLPEGWRKDADYRCPLCGEKAHADAHAAAASGLPRLAGAPAGRKGPASQDASTTAV